MTHTPLDRQIAAYRFAASLIEEIRDGTLTADRALTVLADREAMAVAEQRAASRS